MMRLRIACGLLALILCCAHTGAATSLEQLQAQGRLQLATSLSPDTELVPGQKLTLSLTIATDRWFTGGTRIKIPEVPGLIILQTDQFASNASEMRGGQNWVLQRWSLDVYPQREGAFALPPIAVRIKVNAGDAGDVEGELTSAATRFNTAIPAALAEVEHWVAAPQFTVNQSFDRPLQDLRVGDALQREIIFQASDVMAMMLPTFNAEVLPGLTAYPAPPVLHNNNNRGQVVARRTQRISYMIEAQGQYLLPATDFYWWDTSRGELQLLSLPATEFTVGSGVAASSKASLKINSRQLLRALPWLVGLLLAVWISWKWLPRLPLRRACDLVARYWHRLRALREPALPRRLNPGNSAAE
jgi:hypothetical protein